MKETSEPGGVEVCPCSKGKCRCDIGEIFCICQNVCKPTREKHYKSCPTCGRKDYVGSW